MVPPSGRKAAACPPVRSCTTLQLSGSKYFPCDATDVSDDEEPWHIVVPPSGRKAAVCRPVRTCTTLKLSGSKYFPCLATDMTDNDDSSDESLDGILSQMGSQSTAQIVYFTEDDEFIDPPHWWDFMTNDESWHALWYTTKELKENGIRYCNHDREVPFLRVHRALFRAKSLALECNTLNPDRPHSFSEEFKWPVIWKDHRAYLYNDHMLNGDIDEVLWEESFLRRGNAVSYARKEIITHLADRWHCYWHIGDVHSKREVH